MHERVIRPPAPGILLVVLLVVFLGSRRPDGNESTVVLPTSNKVEFNLEATDNWLKHVRI